MGVYLLFAGILDYPEHEIVTTLTELSGVLRDECPLACERLDEFQAAVAPVSFKRLQESYTEAFDLRPGATSNLSHHMFGEDARRGVFMAEMKGKMEAINLSTGVELPDHIALLLQYMDRSTEEEQAPLIEDCFLPSLKKMREALDGAGNPYLYALEALDQFLKARKPAVSEPDSAVAARLG